MPIYLGEPEKPVEPSLFGDELKRADSRNGRARQQICWCAKCNRLDSRYFGKGVTIAAVRCSQCGGELVTGRARSAKLRFYDAIMERNRALVVSAAHGRGDIDEAVTYAEYAAHTAFKLQLVAYGPEPTR